jgi:transcriptional regulator with XRE-family HTH domain
MKDALKKYQKREKVSGAALARKLNLSRSFISRYLRGQQDMGVATAVKVSSITGVDLLDLLRLETRAGGNRP